jgi:hypothetical protein
MRGTNYLIWHDALFGDAPLNGIMVCPVVMNALIWSNDDGAAKSPPYGVMAFFQDLDTQHV